MSAAQAYLDWNDALAARFFNPETAGQPVYLYVNEDVVAEVGSRLGGGAPDFVEAVRAGPPWVTRAGLCQRALQAQDGWRSRELGFPPYVGYLALFVLAAGLPGDFAVHAYYPRLHQLLDDHEEAAPPSFDRMLELWDDLERWSVHDRGGELGIFEARIVGGWIHVGLPLAQTVLTADERRALPQVFAAADLDPTSPPTGAELAKSLRTHGPGLFRARTLSLLAKGQDAAFVDALLDIVADDLAAWAGNVEPEGPEGEGGEGGGSQVRAALRTCLRIDTIARTLRSSLRCRTAREFPEGGLVLSGASGLTGLQCEEFIPGWSTPLRDAESGEEPELDAAAWAEGVVGVDEQLGWRLGLPGAAVRVFVEGSDQGLPGLVEIRELPRARRFFVAFKSDQWPALREWAETKCLGWQTHELEGLPVGWTFGAAEQTSSDEGVRETFAALAFPDRVRVRFRGGVRSSAGNSFFAFAVPSLLIEGTIEGDEVWLDSTELAQGPCVQPIALPQSLPLDERVGIEVRRGDRVLKRASFYLTNEFDWQVDVPLAFLDYRGQPLPREDEHSAPTIAGSIVRPAPATPFHPDPLLTVPLSRRDRRIFFIGRRPGEVVQWPQESLADSWAPVWAVPMGRRGHALYCGTGLEAAEPIAGEIPGDRDDLWTLVLWRWRKRITPPSNAALAALWRRYQAVARAH